MRNKIEVADIFRRYGAAYREVHGKEMPLRHHGVMKAIEVCRTADLGGHVEECDECGALKISYNSCRNRHCPKCQCLDKERWLEARKKDILLTHYFHVVFTIPEGLRPIALRNQEVVYNLLFLAGSETMKELAGDPKHLGAEIGFIALLHTWTQTLLDHPHIHCIVPGGGLSLDGRRWVSTKEDFFIPVKVLSRKFRGKLLHYLKKAHNHGELVFPGSIETLAEEPAFSKYLSGLYAQEWVVYCKPPFKKPEDVIDYMGRYTHRVAISNDRIVDMQSDRVTFKYRDHSDNEKIKYMSLHPFEFIRRFLLHVLPDGFMKVRHYGVLSNRNRKEKLELCKSLLGVRFEETGGGDKESWEDLLLRLTGIDPRICPICGKGRLVLREKLRPGMLRSPP
jgi:hypothetical protein